MARTQADLAAVLVSGQSVPAQMRPELSVPLAAQMALHPVLDRVVRQFAAWRVQGRAVLERVHPLLFNSGAPAIERTPGADDTRDRPASFGEPSLVRTSFLIPCARRPQQRTAQRAGTDVAVHGVGECLTTGRAEKMPAVDESTRLREIAERIAARLGKREDIDAVLLYGSVARGDAGPDSDIDLLVIGDDAGQTIAELRRWIADLDAEHRAGIAFHTRTSFAALVEEGSRFLVHLRREGNVLLDRTGQLQAFLASPWQPVSVDREIAVELDRLSSYDRPEVFGERFLFPLAHVFTIGKAIVMARLADEGVLEFNRRRAFAEYARRHPAVAPEVELIASLEPFLARTRRKPASMPFPPAGRAAAAQLESGVAAVRRVATTRA